MLRRSRSGALPALLLSIAVLGGCGLFGGDDGEKAGAGAAATTTLATTTTTVPDRRVEVLDAGAAPLRPLRLTFTAGQQVTTTSTFDLDASQDGGRVEVVDAPAVVQRSTLRVDAVAPGGASATVTVVIEDLHTSRADNDLSDAEAAALDERLGRVEGLRGTGTLTADGRFEDLTYTPPPGGDAGAEEDARQAAEQVRSLSVPLPTEPVGVGARWRVITTTESGDVEVRQEATYRLTAADGPVIRYTADLVQVGRAGDLPDAGGTAVRLRSSRLTGTLSAVQDLRTLGATGRSELAGSQQLTVGSGVRARPVEQTLRLTTTFEST